jgi:rRNA-processing protein CGR1
MTEKKTNGSHLTASRLGRIKSGRFWKGDRDRFRSTFKSKGLKQVSTQKRIAQKQQILRVKEYEKSLKEDVKRVREEKKARTEQNKKRKEENEKKNETVQVLKNPAKIKRMKKKQLRMLAKRDVTVVV